MSQFRVTSKPTWKDLRGRWASANQQLIDIRRDELRVLARRHVIVLQKHAPKKTGKFASEHRFRTFQRGDSIGYTTSAPQPLGKWLRPPGTKPHVITPRGPGYPLRFTVGGVEVRAWSVNHPGYRPATDYVEDAYREFKPELRAGLRRISSRYVEQVVK